MREIIEYHPDQLTIFDFIKESNKQQKVKKDDKKKTKIDVEKGIIKPRRMGCIVR